MDEGFPDKELLFAEYVPTYVVLARWGYGRVRKWVYVCAHTLVVLAYVLYIQYPVCSSLAYRRQKILWAQ